MRRAPDPAHANSDSCVLYWFPGLTSYPGPTIFRCDFIHNRSGIAKPMAKSKVGTSTSKVNARKSGIARARTPTHDTRAKNGEPKHCKAAFPENPFATSGH